MSRLILKSTNRLVLKKREFLISPEKYKELIHLPLEEKIRKAEVAIQEFHNFANGKIYVAFSGGKDSTVLLDIVRSLYEEVPGVFINTGLEYPEIIKFVNSKENIIHIKPKLKFQDVIEQYGYPVISKEVSRSVFQILTSKSEKLIHKRLHGVGIYKNGKLSEKWKYLLNAPFKINDICCYKLKKDPAKRFEKETKLFPIIGTMTSDSSFREQNYLKHGGCNILNNKRPLSKPLSIWTENDIWNYIKKYNLPYSTIYDKGYYRTGCMFCAFGVHLESPNKFELMEYTHPQHYKFCMEKLGLRKVLEWINENGKNIHIPF